MLDSYRRVLGRPGALGFSLAGLVGRLPIAMVTLGTVLLVEDATGSYGLAGAVSGTVVAAQAVLAVVHGRMVDAWGQARVLSAAILAWGVCLAALVASVRGGAPTPLVFGLAALTGATMPQVGACARARWSHLLDRPREVQTAYALEGVLDEAVFITGPVLVTLLATAWHPVAGLGVAGVCGLVGTLAFAAQRGTQPSSGRRGDPGPRPPMPWATVVPLALVSLALGAIFGATEVATVAFAEEQGHPAAAGPLLALWALGSLVAGVLTGVVAWRRHPAVRVGWGSLGMTCAMLPLPVVPRIDVMAAVMLVGGLAIAPTLIATASTMELAAPRARLTEAMALLHTGVVGGVAPGAAVAGAVVDSSGASAAYVVSVVAGVSALAAGLVSSRLAAGGPAQSEPAR